MRLLFILDITGSMSDELDACKAAMGSLVTLLSPGPPRPPLYSSDTADPASATAATPDDDNGPLSFAVITFTEDDSSGCHVRLFESSSARAAQHYMQHIRISTPPDAPHLSAGGSDGPENHKVWGQGA